ncbi:MAG: extracellular solute-binding protein, partial [Anaerolineae bacterium]
MKKRKLWSLLSLLVILSMLVAACGDGEDATDTPKPKPTEKPMEEPTKAPTEPEPMAVEVDFAVMPGGFLEKALAGEYAGTTVTVDGPFTDPDDVLFFQSMEAFEEATGITVNYIGDKEFEGRLSIAVDAGDPPDIADFPQPGLLANFARQGFIVDPTTWISQDWLKQQYNQ